jgi:hypothetical protein
MSKHVPSAAAASYCDEDGRPIHDTYFAGFDLGDGLELYSYASFADREAAIDDATAKGMQCQAYSHHMAFQAARNGVPLWKFCEDGKFRPMFLNRRTHVGWKPTVICGGKPSIEKL